MEEFSGFSLWTALRIVSFFRYVAARHILKSLFVCRKVYFKKEPKSHCLGHLKGMLRVTISFTTVLGPPVRRVERTVAHICDGYLISEWVPFNRSSRALNNIHSDIIGITPISKVRPERR